LAIFVSLAAQNPANPVFPAQNNPPLRSQEKFLLKIPTQIQLDKMLFGARLALLINNVSGFKSKPGS